MASSTIAIIIMTCMLILFALDKIPVWLTAMLAVMAMGLFGVIEFSDVFKGFSNDITFLGFGAIALGNMLSDSGVTTVFGKKILKMKFLVGNERVFVIAMFSICCAISIFMSNTVAVAMLMPIIGSIAAATNGKITKKHSFMAIGIASVLGGNVFLISSTPQLAAQNILESEGLRALGFAELAKGALPLIGVGIVYFLTVGYSIQKKVFTFPETYSEDVSEAETAAPINMRKMYLSVIIFVSAIVGLFAGWATYGYVAILAVCIGVLTGCISPKRLFLSMDWNTVVVLAAALGFADGMNKSGAAQIIANVLLSLVGNENIFLLSAMLILIATLLSQLMSNVAVVTILTPLAIALASGMSIDPIPFVVMVILGASLVFATPMGTTPMTMTLAGGYRFMDYVKVGGVLNVILVIVAVAMLPFIYGLI